MALAWRISAISFSVPGSSCAPSSRYNRGMSQSNAPQASHEAEPTLFSALLTPHRSLGNTGFLVVMGLIAGLSFMAGIMFLLLGAWPVMPFLGLDVVLIYWAFRANYRAAAAYEEGTVTPSELHVKKVRDRKSVV